MPSVSAKQKKLMDAAAHNSSFAKSAGVPQNVAKDFSEASKGMKFKSTTRNRADRQAMNSPKTDHGNAAFFNKGGAMKKGYADGGMSMVNKGGKMVPDFAADGKGKMAKGGMAKADMKQDKGMMQKAVNKHEGRLHKGESMTKLAKGGSASSRADGMATKGKTKGTAVMMKRGGKTC
jgi:hypothetical protein